MPSATAAAKDKDKDKASRREAAQPPAPPAPPPPPEASEPPPPRPPLRRLMDHPGYAAAAALLAELQGQASAVEGRAAAVRQELGDAGPASRLDMEALALLGAGDPGASGRVAELLAEADVLAGRGRVLARAVQLQEQRVAEQKHLAGREVLRSAGPEYRRLLLAHVKDVVVAAVSQLEFRHWLDAVELEMPPGSGGVGDYSFTFLGDIRQHESSVPLWLAELVSLGLLDGTEDFLNEVRMIAVRGGKTVVDRPSPDPMTQGRPAPPKSPGASALGAVGAAVRAGVAAVAGLVGGKGRPDADALPAIGHADQTAPPARKWIGGPKASDAPEAKTIRLLRDLVNPSNEWPTGWVGKWESVDAARLVERGFAEWADAPAAGAAEVAPVSSVEA